MRPDQITESAEAPLEPAAVPKVPGAPMNPADPTTSPPIPTRWARRLMWVAWPAFLVAAVLEMMVFAVLDPQSLALFGERVTWSRYTIYSATFFIFWAMTMISSGLTVLLSMSPRETNERQWEAMAESLAESP